jgi:adenylate cyclase
MAATVRRFRLGNALISAGIGLAGAALVLALRTMGALEGPELSAYDAFLRSQAQHIPAADNEIALVEQNENDIQTYDYPLPDAQLAELLSKIEKQQPAAIGLDLYRDLAEPRSGKDLQALASVLAANDNIVCAFKFGDAHHPFEIPPPAILKARLDRIGFNDFPSDYKFVRRAFLYLADSASNSYPSFALQLASFENVSPLPVAGRPDLVNIGGAPVYRFAKNTGGYASAAAGGYQFLLDFKGPRTFQSHSLEDVFENRISRDEFTGKVVLIGQAASSGNDNLITPLRDDQPGVEMHALVVDQLLRMQEKGARVMRAWGGLAQAGWLLWWCLVAAAIGYYCRAPLLFTAAPVTMVLLLFCCCKIAFDAGWWIPLIPPLAGGLPVTAMVVAFMGYREKADRSMLMSIFSRHVSPAVADTIWEQRELFARDQRLIPRQLTATLLFTDLQNFSTVSEGMQPEELLAWVNEYMEMLVRHVERYGGMVNKYMGDSIMAVFGAPVPSTSPEEIQRDAYNSVKCAIAMGGELDRLNIKRRAERRPTTNMRVGIYTGPAVSGSIGSLQRMEFTLLGDTVNTASRLESFDKDCFADQTCRILIGETTRDLIESQFHLEYVKTIELKGQHEKTGIYYVPRDKNDEEGSLVDGARGCGLAGDIPGAGKHPGALPGAQGNADTLPSAGLR